MNNYKVYIHIFPNDKKYIGITKIEPKKRWGKNGYCYRKQNYIYKAIKKYGWENIEHKILYENLTKEEAEQKEIELIAFYKSNQGKYGYNIANGGHVHCVSQETKEKIIKANKEKLSIRIWQFDLEYNFVKEWSSISEAKRQTGICNINRCLQGKQETAGGYFWDYFK